MQSTAGQAEPKVCSTGGVIKALREAHRGEKGQKGELITHNVEEEEEVVSPKAAWKTHTHSQQHCLENQAPCVSAQRSAEKVNMLLIFTAVREERRRRADFRGLNSRKWTDGGDA